MHFVSYLYVLVWFVVVITILTLIFTDDEDEFSPNGEGGKYHVGEYDNE